MCGPAAVLMGVSTALTMYGAHQQYKAQNYQGEYMNAVAKRNAQLAEMQAADAINRGAEEAADVRRAVDQRKSDQIAALAAAGVDVNYGSAVDLLASTEALGQQDVLTTMANAEREAADLRYEAQNFRIQGAMQAAGAQNRAQASLITGTTQVASGWYNYATTVKK